MVDPHENIYPVILYLASSVNAGPIQYSEDPAGSLDQPLFFEILDKIDLTVFRLDGVYNDISLLISQPWPDYIVVADWAVCAPEAQIVVDAILLQVQRGAKLVLTGNFALGPPKLLDAFFFRIGLDWRYGGSWVEEWTTTTNIETSDQHYIARAVHGHPIAATVIHNAVEEEVWLCHRIVAEWRADFLNEISPSTPVNLMKTGIASGPPSVNPHGTNVEVFIMAEKMYPADAVPIVFHPHGKGYIGFVGLQDHYAAKAVTFAMLDIAQFPGRAYFKRQGYRHRMVTFRDQNLRLHTDLTRRPKSALTPPSLEEDFFKPPLPPLPPLPMPLQENQWIEAVRGPRRLRNRGHHDRAPVVSS